MSKARLSPSSELWENLKEDKREKKLNRQSFHSYFYFCQLTKIAAYTNMRAHHLVTLSYWTRLHSLSDHPLTRCLFTFYLHKKKCMHTVSIVSMIKGNPAREKNQCATIRVENCFTLPADTGDIRQCVKWNSRFFFFLSLCAWEEDRTSDPLYSISGGKNEVYYFFKFIEQLTGDIYSRRDTATHVVESAQVSSRVHEWSSLSYSAYRFLVSREDDGLIYMLRMQSESEREWRMKDTKLFKVTLAHAFIFV